MKKEIKESLRVVLDYVERWNKGDKEKEVAKAAQDLEEEITIAELLDKELGEL